MFRCPKCGRQSSETHELEPRSRGEWTNKMQNRTAICRYCHNEFHKQGASEVNVRVWKEIIKMYLESIGNWEKYENWGQDG